MAPFWKTCKEALRTKGLAMYNTVATGSQKLGPPVISLKLTSSQQAPGA